MILLGVSLGQIVPLEVAIVDVVAWLAVLQPRHLVSGASKNSIKIQFVMSSLGGFSASTVVSGESKIVPFSIFFHAIVGYVQASPKG